MFLLKSAVRGEAARGHDRRGSAPRAVVDGQAGRPYSEQPQPLGQPSPPPSPERRTCAHPPASPHPGGGQTWALPPNPRGARAGVLSGWSPRPSISRTWRRTARPLACAGPGSDAPRSPRLSASSSRGRGQFSLLPARPHSPAGPWSLLNEDSLNVESRTGTPEKWLLLTLGQMVGTLVSSGLKIAFSPGCWSSRRCVRLAVPSRAWLPAGLLFSWKSPPSGEPHPTRPGVLPTPPPGQSKRGHSAGFRDACPSPCGLGSAANPESSSLCRGRRRGILGPNTQFLRKPQAVTGPPPQVAGAGRPVGSGLHDCEPVPAASSPGRERDGADGQRGGTPRVRVRFVRCPERLWRQESPRRLPGAEGGSGKCGVSCWVRTAWSQTAVHSLLKQLKPLDRPRELVKMVRFTLHEV